MQPPHSIRGIVLSLACGTCGCTLPVNPAGLACNFLGEKAAIQLIAVYLVSSGLFSYFRLVFLLWALYSITIYLLDAFVVLQLGNS